VAEVKRRNLRKTLGIFRLGSFIIDMGLLIFFSFRWIPPCGVYAL